MALCDRLEASLRKAQTESARLLEATLQGALSQPGERFTKPAVLP